ncbi:MAG: hypothetical protein IJS59_06725 [Bacteroidaceae bacterium]|nr:hypothetical protein [Bacteroidaceae bacterium]
MKTSILSIIAATVILNVAPGYDACGNKIKGYHFDEDTVAYDADSLGTAPDSTSIDADTTGVDAPPTA